MGRRRPAATIRNCPGAAERINPQNFAHLSVCNMSCAQAAAKVRVSTRHQGRVPGWRCENHQTGQDQGYQRCVLGRKSFRWYILA